AGKASDSCVSFTWISTSPDGRWAAVPLRDVATQRYEVALVDLGAKSHRIVPDAKGPVGFTGDSQTIVSYVGEGHAPVGSNICRGSSKGEVEPSAPPGPEHIVLVDVTTLERRTVKIPRLEHFNFHVLAG